MVLQEMKSTSRRNQLLLIGMSNWLQKAATPRELVRQWFFDVGPA
jgi:hypothetical protein